MDENDVLKAGMEVMLRPVTDLAENALGLAGGDWLSEKRIRTRAKLKQKTAEIFERSGIKPENDPSPSVIVPLLSAAQDEGREELLDLWAKLLASSMNPKKSAGYRREFVEIVNELEPIDVVVLPYLRDSTAMQPNRLHFIAGRVHANPDLVEISFRNLLRLQLIENAPPGGNNNTWPLATALGRQLLALVSD